MMVGDYVLSSPKNCDNCANRCHFRACSGASRRRCLAPGEFRALQGNESGCANLVAERGKSDLMFLRLPAPVVQPPKDSVLRWREEWLEGNDSFWGEIEQKRAGQLGARVQSKQQYLGFVEDLLHTAAHIPAWPSPIPRMVLSPQMNSWETIGRVRRVREVYSKDFSDLLGVRAAIVTAN